MGETVTDNREAIRQQLLDAVPEDQQDMLDRFRPLEDEPVGGGGRSDGEPAANSGDGGLCAVHVPGRDTGAGGSLLLLALGALFARRRVARHR
jgi:MYXO-CTERM domain-containing protein